MAKFCTKCGRRLQEGEICTCDQQQNYDGSYEQQTISYAQQSDTYENQNGTYEQPGNTYEQPGNTYESQSNTYGQPDSFGNQQNKGFYEQGNPYAQQDASYEQQNGAYGQQNSGAYSQQNGGAYGQQNNGTYGQQNGAYYQQNNGYGQQNGAYYQQNGAYGQQGQPYGNPYNQQGMTKEAEWINQKKDAFVSVTKNMFSEILPILKSPVSRVRMISESNTSAVGIEFIVTKAVVFLLLVLIVLFRVKSMLGYASAYVTIPWLKIIILTLLLTAGADFLEALLLKGFTAIFNGATQMNAMLTAMGAKGLYETLIILISGVLALIYPMIGVVVYFFASMLVTYIEYNGYQVSVQCQEDKIPYAFFLVKVCMTVIIAILVVLMAGDIVSSIAGTTVSNVLGELL